MIHRWSHGFPEDEILGSSWIFIAAGQVLVDSLVYHCGGYKVFSVLACTCYCVDEVCQNIIVCNLAPKVERLNHQSVSPTSPEQNGTVTSTLHFLKLSTFIEANYSRHLDDKMLA